MSVKTIIAKIAEHFTVFGPAPTGVIPADARPLSEAEDPTEIDRNPTTVPTSTHSPESPDEDGEDEGSADPEEGDAQDGADQEAPGGTSVPPSPSTGTDAGATEAADGASEAVVTAVRAAVEALVTLPEEAAPGKRTFQFQPTITKEMLADYEASVERGDTAAALSRLLGQAVAEAFEAYDERVVAPVLSKVQADRREASNKVKVSQWVARNPAKAADAELWQQMAKTYDFYARTYGPARADRISVEHIAILSAAALGRSAVGAGATKAASKAKATALASTKMPGAIGTLRAGKQTGKRAAYSGNEYRQHIKANRRDPF